MRPEENCIITVNSGGADIRTFVPGSVSLKWVVLAWSLFQSQRLLWILACFPFILSSVFATLLVTGHLQPIASMLLPLVGTSPGLEGRLVLLAAFALLLSLLLANTALTSMANKAVRGNVLGTRDLFRFRGFGHTTFVLIVILLVTIAGSLAFLVGAIVAAGALLGAESTALRTGSVRLALRSSASILRSDPVRALCLGLILLLGIALGIATGGLVLLAALPIAKIVGAIADVYAEVLCRDGSRQLSRAGSVELPQPAQFRWTSDEEAALRQSVPPLHIPHVVAASLIAGLAAFLLYPRLPNVAAGLPAPGPTALPVAAVQMSTAQPAPAAPVKKEPTSVAAEPGFVDSFGPVNNYATPARMHWGSYTVQVETGDMPSLPMRVTILNAERLAIYVVTDDNINLVKREPLLGGATPELLIQTSEGADGTYGMEIALTQQGGVHNLFLLHNEYVTPQRESGSNAEEVVVNTPLDLGDWPLALHHVPALTSTYKWDGNKYRNATLSSPAATLASMKQCEQVLLTPGKEQYEVVQNTASLLVNARILGVTHFPAAVTASSGYQQGVTWLAANKSTWVDLLRAAAAMPQVLPNVRGNSI